MLIIALPEEHYNNPNHTRQLWPHNGPMPMEVDLRILVLRAFVGRLPRAAFMLGQPVLSSRPDPSSRPTRLTCPTWPSCPCPPSCPTRPSACPAVHASVQLSTRLSIRHIRLHHYPTPNPSSVILPCSRHWTASERVRKLGKGCCIASLGFGRVVTLIDVVLVDRHGGGHCGSGREMCLFRRRI